MAHRLITLVAGLFVVAMVGAPVVALEKIEDPVPGTIKKGDLVIELKLVAEEGISNPVWLTHAGDGSGRLFIVDQGGKVHVVAKGGRMLKKPLLDVSDRIVIKKGFDERGLLCLAFHPDYAKKGAAGEGKMYTYTSEATSKAGPADFPSNMEAVFGIPCDHQAVITEWSISKDRRAKVDMSSRREIMRIDEPMFNHDGGGLAFDENGLLFISLGDGGGGNGFGPGHAMPHGNGQDTSTPLGSILRIDPLGKKGKKSANGQYSNPNDNPYVKGGGLAEIYAIGMRNPYRISYDVQSKQLIAGDIGQENVEEINVIKKGGNYGWRIREGDYYFHPQAEKFFNITRETTETGLPKTLGATLQYDQQDGVSVIGGFIYRGKAIKALKGKYVFGDYKYMDPNLPRKEQVKPASGRIFFSPLKKGATIKEFVLGKGDRRIGEFVLGMGQDEDGEVYVLTSPFSSPVDHTDGKVYKIVPVK